MRENRVVGQGKAPNRSNVRSSFPAGACEKLLSNKLPLTEALQTNLPQALALQEHRAIYLEYSCTSSCRAAPASDHRLPVKVPPGTLREAPGS